MSDRRSGTSRFGAVLLLALGMAVTGCGDAFTLSPAPASPAVSVRLPTDAASDFLRAMGAGDQAHMNADLVPERRTTDWQDRPVQNVFDKVQCRPGPQVDTPANSVVVCEFDVLEDWSGFAAGHVNPWGVWLRREASGPWLVYDWGVPV